MYSIGKEVTFEAAHFLSDYEGNCRNPHGHSYRATVEIACPTLIEEGSHKGMVVDFAAVKRVVKNKYDHALLNDLTDFLAIPPTAENLAKAIWDTIQNIIKDENPAAFCMSVTVSETQGSYATFMPDESDVIA